MIISNLTSQLALVLFATAILFAVIGACIMRFVCNAKMHRIRQHDQLEISALQRECKAREEQSEEILETLESESRLLARAQDKQSQLLAQQDALQVHARIQAQRLLTLEAELKAAEEKSLRIQSDFASFKANKQNELRMLRGGGDAQSLEESEAIPVLNRRVSSSEEHEFKSGQYRARDNTMDFSKGLQPLIASELDIPSLAESELPDSVEDLEFDLMDSAEPIWRE